ncbi:hypothetical protein GA0070615_6183 [Micromonospora aurantiaca]|nr:hypothetical protein GA0070615_6183 [Micromonospora aurantiaca]
MPTDTSIVKIICEWHEDFIIVRNQPPFLELVSVKHHDRLVYTTMKSLCDEGGIAHLFDRWLGYTSRPAVRLASNTPSAAGRVNTHRVLSTRFAGPPSWPRLGEPRYSHTWPGP